MSKGKVPAAKFSPALLKQARVSEGKSYHDERPAWRISRMDFVDPFGWHRVDAALFAGIREKLGQLESRTWAEILVQSRKQNHSVAIADQCKHARDRLSQIFRGNIDIDELVSLRLSGRERVWGILERGVLTICGGTPSTWSARRYRSSVPNAAPQLRGYTEFG
ncbi:MAG: hypothetical protein U0Q16_22255 [Bryobacteraceae bacterium]